MTDRERNGEAPAMRIQTIKITNYKAFLGSHEINVDGKNLFIYGENGSGKSSFYYALKDFFQSSIEDIDLADLENIFVSEDEKDKTEVKVSFNPDHQGRDEEITYSWNNIDNETRSEDGISIRDGNKIKSFLTYKHLMNVHHLKKDKSINLFDLLVKGVLRHFKSPIIDDRELGDLWTDVEEAIARGINEESLMDTKEEPIMDTNGDPIMVSTQADIDGAIRVFNQVFGELFRTDGPDNIEDHVNLILDHFEHNVKLSLQFSEAALNDNHSGITGAEVNVKLRYADKPVDKPHLFLNEARLSAIAISIYLSMIKRHAQDIPCKVLFLDDIFIGLDIANRLPLLDILESEFSGYQIFITTYDKPWFEHAKHILEQKKDWKSMEFYAKLQDNGTEIPVISDNQDMIKKANYHLEKCDYKAAAVYTRSAFEKAIRKFCAKKKLRVKFNLLQKNYDTNDFWDSIKEYNQNYQKKYRKELLDDTIISVIETYRSLVLNPFSHYNTEKHEIRRELKCAIDAVEKLGNKLTELTKPTRR